MFAKKPKDTLLSRESPLDKSDIKAFLGPGSQFEGRLVFNEIVRLDGAFRGEVTSQDTLIVGDSADLEADITVGTLILSGHFRGSIKAVNRVELRAPAQVEGTIETPVLTVEAGVVFNGTVNMKPGDAGDSSGWPRNQP